SDEGLGNSARYTFFGNLLLAPRIERQKLVMSILVLKNPIAARHQLQIWIGAGVVKLLGVDKDEAFFFPVRVPKKHSSGIGFFDEKLNALWVKGCERLLKDVMDNLSRGAGENRSTVDRFNGVKAEDHPESGLYSGQLQIHRFFSRPFQAVVG